MLPVLWVISVRLAGGYDSRFIGVGTDEFRRVLNAGICLTAVVAIVSYATKTDLARGYVVIALPSLTVLDLVARFTLRKRLHKLRALGSCMRKVVVVGHLDVVTTWPRCCAGRATTDSPSWPRAWPAQRAVRRLTRSRSSPAWTT